MKGLWRDLGYGARLLVRKPGFTSAAVLSLVLGIGLNTAIFTLLDAIFLRPLAVDDPDKLASVYVARKGETGQYDGFLSHSHPNFLDLQERVRSFSGMAAYIWHQMNLTGGSEPVRATGMFVSSNYFNILGLEPYAGRFFRVDEGKEGADPVAVLSYGCWSRSFGSDDGILGDNIEVNGLRFTVVGVAPRGFKGTEVGLDMDFWVPTSVFEEISPYRQWFDTRGAALFRVVGRLADGVSLEQAHAELMRLSQQLAVDFPVENEGLGAKIKPLIEGTLSPGQRERHVGYGKILLIAVGLILLMSCLNVASLLLIRGIERGREIAIRRSLGASRQRMGRQLVIENLLLFLVGGALSLPVARWSLDLLWRFRPPQFAEDALDLTLDATIFGFALLTALVSGLVFGVLPAWRAARLDLVSHLKEAVMPTDERGVARPWLQPRRLLVTGQVALALISLVAAGLYLRSLHNATRIDVGFDAERLLALSFAPGEQGYEPERARGFYRQALERVEELPGVAAAGLSENRLLRGAIIRQQVFLEGEDTAFEGGGRAFHRTNTVFPGFFATAGIPLLRGDDFDDSIQPDGPRVAIVNETMAKLAWPNQDPVGKRFRLDYSDRPLVSVIGVARDAKYREMHESAQCFLYFPEIQRHAPAMTLHVRADGDPGALLAPVRETVLQLAPDLPIADVRTLGDFVKEALWIERASATLLGVFGLLALALSSLGIYSVLAEAVNQRRREMGVRMAIGAGRGDVLQVIAEEAAKLVGAGLVVGLIGALAVMKISSSVSDQLYGVSTTDPWIYLGAAAVLLGGSIIGFLLPALRATRTDPVKALRAE
ncbi:MAG: ABC transporter permease [Acidobacteriota bacterium]